MWTDSPFAADPTVYDCGLSSLCRSHGRTLIFSDSVPSNKRGCVGAQRYVCRRGQEQSPCSVVHLECWRTVGFAGIVPRFLRVPWSLTATQRKTFFSLSDSIRVSCVTQVTGCATTVVHYRSTCFNVPAARTATSFCKHFSCGM